MSRISPRVPIRTLSAFLVVATGASPASATVVEAVYGLGGSVIDYRIKFMPDLDQRRSSAPGIPGLPRNGAMYCVPSASVNLFAYAANHGFPQTAPGPGTWQSNALYNDATAAINSLGSIMGTAPTQGTDLFGWDVGMMVQTAASPLLMWKTKQLTPNASPTVEQMAALACSGWIVSFAWGRYDDIGVPGFPVLLRTGGHAVNLTRDKKQGQMRQIAYRDPADAPVGTTQSPFNNRETNFQTQLSNSVVPQTYPMASDGSVSVNPETGRMWFFTQAANVAIGVLLNPATGLLNIETVQIPGVPTDIAAGWHDRLRVVADGSVREFIRIDGNWMVNASSPFHGLASGPKFFMARSSSNLDPSAPQLPGQFNIDPDDQASTGTVTLGMVTGNG